MTDKATRSQQGRDLTVTDGGVPIAVIKTSASRFTPELRDNSPFGTVFTDHMLVADYTNGEWSDPTIVPYEAQVMAPAPAVAHYGQGVFEGFKAYPRPRGGAVLFRPHANHARMTKSCRRLAMPEVPASMFVEGTRALVRLDRKWIRDTEGGSLYIRPVLFATSESLGGAHASNTFRFVIEACPSGTYFSGSVDLLVEAHYVRAFPGGTGDAKCAGNYASALLATNEARKRGFHNVLWLDGLERKYVEEAGVMNVMFVIDDTVVTPALSGTILAGITRDSVLALLRDMKIPVDERRISIDEIFDAHARGALSAAAGVGTAAFIAPLRRLRYKEREITIPALSQHSPLARAGAVLEGIRSGSIADRYNWLVSI